jgi:hypothetical protein
MKKTLILSSLIFASSIIILNSCKKKVEVDNETQSVVDNSICEQQFMSIQPVVNNKGIQEKGLSNKTASVTCEAWNVLGAISGTNSPNVATDTIVVGGVFQNGPVTFEIDYGTVGCVGDDGITRIGKIHITTNKKWSQLGTVVTVNLLNYKANGVTYSGIIKVTRPDAVTITTEVMNGTCTDGTWTIEWNGTKTMKQIAGGNTPNILADDVFTIEGNSTGKNREGRTFTTLITSPLVKKTNCKYITSGTLELTPDGFKTRTVDFGNGACDDDATFTVNGQTVAFKLK